MIYKKFVALLAIVIFSIFSQMTFLSDIVNAENWSWNEKPTIASSNQLTNTPAGFCPTTYELHRITIEKDKKLVCVQSGEKLKFGTYHSWQESSFVSVLAFPFDDKMYQVNTGCYWTNGCIYLPTTDTLIVRRYVGFGYVRTLDIYKNFSKRLTRAFNTKYLTTEYNFDSSNPDFTYRSDNGDAWAINTVSASNNGKWLVIESHGRGIILLNTETYEAKKVSPVSHNYNAGANPTVEMAVDNSGRFIVLMGERAGFYLFINTPECGNHDNETLPDQYSPIPIKCKESPILPEDFIHDSSGGSHPVFNDDGAELSFYATSYSSPPREVSIRAAGYNNPRLDYLALGDSFSSGEGETDDKNYIPGTNEPYEKCHVSTRSYPYLVASLSNINPNFVKNVACSGATTKDVVGDDKYYIGQGDRLSIVNPDYISLLKTEARSKFIPGRIHQNIFLKKYIPKVVTIGIGGNDAGFMKKLATCLSPGTCNWASDKQKLEQTAIELKDLFNTLVNTYNEMHLSSPGSKIYAVGYPKIISQDGDCGLFIGTLLDSTERRFMNEGIIYINEIIAAAAKKVGIGYLDIQESHGDHVLCGASNPDTMNSIRLGDDNNLIEKYDWTKIIGQESFHPNPLGHYYESLSIFNYTKNILSFNYCPTGATICSIETQAPEPSKYWIPDNNHSYPLLKYENFTADTKDNQTEKQLKISNLSLLPNGLVDIEINSTPRKLGSFTADSNGALDVTVNLPSDLEEGFHTIHIYGASYSGESIDIYQIIEYRLPVIKPLIDINTTKIVKDNSDNTSAVTADKPIEIKINDKNGINDLIDPIIATTNKINDKKSDVKGAKIIQAKDQNKILSGGMLLAISIVMFTIILFIRRKIIKS